MSDQDADFNYIARLSAALDKDISIREEAEMSEFNMRKVLVNELFDRKMFNLLSVDIMCLRDIVDSNNVPHNGEDFVQMMLDEVLCVRELAVVKYLESVRSDAKILDSRD